MIEALRELFTINRTVVLFAYGLTFFVLGFAIFLNARSHSRLRLARQLRWLAAFGILHGLYEWGDIFIPLQASYLSAAFINGLRTVQTFLLALSFMCLLGFGAVLVENRWPRVRTGMVVLIGTWLVMFVATYGMAPSARDWVFQSNIAARYLLCLPGGILAGYGLAVQTRASIAPLAIGHITRDLAIASGALIAYAVFAGAFVRYAPFFPANVINRDLLEANTGIPIEVLRSITGLVLVVTVIRALDIFEIELERQFEAIDIERAQAAERERIGQEIHDGAIQGIYSASLILESMNIHMQPGSEAARRLQQARNVLHAVNADLRSYMIALRTCNTPDSLCESLGKLVSDPRFEGLLDIKLACEDDLPLSPLQINHLLGIVHESLSNALRHARATCVRVSAHRLTDTLILTIEDDGRGFSPDAATAGYGLRSMRDRARLLGGQLDVDSQPGRGTRIRLTLREEGG